MVVMTAEIIRSSWLDVEFDRDELKTVCCHCEHPLGSHTVGTPHQCLYGEHCECPGFSIHIPVPIDDSYGPDFPESDWDYE